MSVRRPIPEISEAKQAHDEQERPPLPPGHPVAWEVLTDGTLLEGTAYPLPVFL